MSEFLSHSGHSQEKERKENAKGGGEISQVRLCMHARVFGGAGFLTDMCGVGAGLF